MKLEIANKLFINVPKHLVKIYNDFEPLTTSYVSNHLRPGDVFLDVGANIGYFSALASRLVGESGHVYAVEASPEVLPILRDNTTELGNVSLLDFAVGNRRGWTDFYLTDDYVNSGVSMNPFLDNARKITIPIETLDHWYFGLEQERRRVDFIKCDVQGDELAVLEGARKLIASTKHLKLIIEWAPTWMKKAGYDPESLPVAIESLGFKEVLIVDDWLQKEMSVHDMRVEFARDVTARRFCNIFAAK
jgi:FkbM family methyltransferase